MLSVGDTVNREYPSTIYAKTMGADGAFTRQGLTDTNEQLVVNQEKDASFYIKKLDEIQNKPSVRNKYAELSMIALFNKVDGDALAEIANATESVDDGDLGGTAGTALTASTTNVHKVFVQARKFMQRNNILLNPNDRFTGKRESDMVKRYGVAAISPDFYATLLDYVGGKESVFGDQVARSGHAGHYLGFELFISNALYWTGTLAVATQPTDGDTVVINGVTFTYKTTLGTTAGNILIGASAATAVDAIVAATNNSESLAAEAAGTLYVELTAANRSLIDGITATDATTTATFVSKGWGYVIVSETFTDGTDTWTAAKQVEHQYFGVNASTDVVIQKSPNTLVQPRSGYVGSDVATWTAYGIKTFNEQKVMMVDVQTRSDAY
jgi:hypothetical protein